MGLEDEFSQVCAAALEEVGLPVRFSKSSSSTEAAQYSQAGYPSLTFGPGRFTGNSHSPNEFNTLDQFEKSVQFYEKVIEKVCL
jgi:acetylornithine deacetylase/succinyl-diaminopimelate desuccinylase-like protein